MTSPQDKHPAGEVDPTGMRQLLRSLPDPGPMPAGLVVRITDSIAREAADYESAAAGSEQSVPETAGDGSGGSSGDGYGTQEPAVWDLPRTGRSLPGSSGRRRRTRADGHWHYQRTPALVAAAAVAAFAGLGAVVTSGLPGKVAAVATGSFGSAADTAAAGGAAEPEAGPAAGSAAGPADVARQDASSPGQAATAGALPVHITASERNWNLDTLVDAAPGLLQDLSSSSGESAMVAAKVATLGAVGTVEGAHACAAAIGLPPEESLAVDFGTHEGAVVAALVSRDAAGRITVAIVHPSCGASGSGASELSSVIQGPATLP